MTIRIGQITAAFAGEVSGIDITNRCRARMSRPSKPAWIVTPCWCSTISP